jgi:hypothetical protein
MFKIRAREVLSLISLILFLFSCRKHEVQSSGTLELSTLAIRLDTTVGTQSTFTVQSTVAWTTQVSPVNNWLRMDISSGAPGKTVIRLTVLSNNRTAIPQTAIITFSPAGNNNIQPVMLTVTQKPYSFNLGFRKALGGTKFDAIGSQAIRSLDGGTVIVGTSFSDNGDVHHNHGGADAWIVKLNATGDTVWTKTYGGTLDDDATAIVATPDGGYTVIGSAKSNDGDVHGNHGDADLWLLKLDTNGDTLWTKTYGGSVDEGNGCIVSTPDGGYAVAGFTGSNDGDVRGNHGSHDMWLIKLNSNGDLLWSKVYGGSSLDEARSITAAPDGGFVLAGLTASNDNDVTGYHIPTFIGFDMWIVKVDGNGNKLWAHAFGGTVDDVAISVSATAGGYVVAGYTNSNDGDVTGYHGPANSPLFYDMLVLRLDENGNKLWARAYGGTFDEYGLAVISTTDGGFVIAGGASSKNGDVSGYQGNGGALDIWVIKLDEAGNKQWGKTIGGSGDDYSFSIMAVPDGFIVGGLTDGSDGDMAGAGSHGDYDIWVTKLIVQ